MKMKSLPIEWSYLHDIKKMTNRTHGAAKGTAPTRLVENGDDAFVAVPSKQPIVMCQDMMVEGVHFSLDYFSARDLGHKSLAVNLSDIAAMGALPQWAMVSIALPQKLNKSWLDEFYVGMTALADAHSVEIVGGDLCQSPTLTIDVSVFGNCEKPLLRTGTQKNDLLFCSGPLGLSAEGMLQLQNKQISTSASQRHLRPQPRLDLVPFLQKNAQHIHGLIDVSDGLVSEILHLTKNMDLGIELDLNDFIKKYQLKQNSILWGGEDYELLLTAPPDKAHLFDQWSRLGQFNESNQLQILKSDGQIEIIEEYQGWNHFFAK